VGDVYDADNQWFYRYNIAENYWENLENTPFGQGPGGAIAWYENSDGEYLFAWIGTTSATEDPAASRYSEFWRYNVQTAHWDQKLISVKGYSASGTTGTTPYGSDDASCLVWTGEENYLYYLVGAYNESIPGPEESHFLRYHIKENTWENLASVPYNGVPADNSGVDDGGSLVWGGGNYLYLTKGGDGNGSINADNFYRFNIAENRWENMPWLPRALGQGYNGARLGFAAGKLYFLPAYYPAGAPETGFWVFDHIYYTQGRYTSRSFDAGQTVNWDNISWSATLPSLTRLENDNVGQEPDPMIDGARIGTVVSGSSYENTRDNDGVYENIRENNIGTPIESYTYVATII